LSEIYGSGSRKIVLEDDEKIAFAADANGHTLGYRHKRDECG
jgi:hypothetical protein